jgi:hypothetical protein
VNSSKPEYKFEVTKEVDDRGNYETKWSERLDTMEEVVNEIVWKVNDWKFALMFGIPIETMREYMYDYGIDVEGDRISKYRVSEMFKEFLDEMPWEIFLKCVKLFQDLVIIFIMLKLGMVYLK